MLHKASCYTVLLLRSYTYCISFKSATLLRNSEINHKYAYCNFLIKRLVFFPGERIERYCLPVNGIPIAIIKNEY